MCSDFDPYEYEPDEYEPDEYEPDEPYYEPDYDVRYSDEPWEPDGGSAPWDDCEADPDMCCGYDH